MVEAAGLLGGAALLRDHTGEVLSAADEAEHQKILADIDAALGPAEFRKAWSAGRVRAESDPIAYGLEHAAGTEGAGVQPVGQRPTGGPAG